MDEQQSAETQSARLVRDLVEHAGVGVVASLIGLASGGPFGAMLASGIGALAARGLSMHRDAVGRVDRTVERGGHLADLSIDQLTDWSEGDPRRIELLSAVVDSAAQSRAESHLDALARVLADGIHDDARLDVDTRVAHALGALGLPEVEVLRKIRQLGSDTAEGTGLTVKMLSEQVLPRLGEGMDFLVAVLEAQGCVGARSAGEDGGWNPWYQVTPFGRLCLSFLDDRLQKIRRDSTE